MQNLPMARFSELVVCSTGNDLTLEVINRFVMNATAQSARRQNIATGFEDVLRGNGLCIEACFCLLNGFFINEKSKSKPRSVVIKIAAAVKELSPSTIACCVTSLMISNTTKSNVVVSDKLRFPMILKMRIRKR